MFKTFAIYAGAVICFGGLIFAGIGMVSRRFQMQSQDSSVTGGLSGRDIASLETGAGAKSADDSMNDLSEVIPSLGKKTQGESPLRLLLAARSPEQLRNTVPSVHRIFVGARTGDERDLGGALRQLCNVPS